LPGNLSDAILAGMIIPIFSVELISVWEHSTINIY
jgi:hypothetical protein